MLEGLENVFDEIVIEDDWIADTEFNINIGFNIDDDVFTKQSEDPFFPLPSVNEPVAAMQQQQPATATELATGTATELFNEFGTIYAPISVTLTDFLQVRNVS